jgi:DNA-binding HxlR family transcriptional regulator
MCMTCGSYTPSRSRAVCVVGKVGAVDPIITAGTVDLIGRRWSLPILDALRLGPQRYTDLLYMVSLGSKRIPAKSLTETLRRLERHGILEHLNHVEAGTYRLTGPGRELLEHVDVFAQWVARNRDALSLTGTTR